MSAEAEVRAGSFLRAARERAKYNSNSDSERLNYLAYWIIFVS